LAGEYWVPETISVSRPGGLFCKLLDVGRAGDQEDSQDEEWEIRTMCKSLMPCLDVPGLDVPAFDQSASFEMQRLCFSLVVCHPLASSDEILPKSAVRKAILTPGGSGRRGRPKRSEGHAGGTTFTGLMGGSSHQQGNPSL
jgi:hypothetical protein